MFTDLVNSRNNLLLLVTLNQTASCNDFAFDQFETQCQWSVDIFYEKIWSTSQPFELTK